VPPKARVPAPIDRPLSKAYLREFSGWSTAFPPGLSDPTSLRVMENVMVNRDGSARVRPGLRYLSFASAGVGIDKNCVGTHEPFFLNDGTKAYLFAVREADSTVGFRVLVGSTVKLLTAAGVDFTIPQGAGVLAFSSATTYVKYLQIDNKIFALSNAGESMRLFVVGTSKSARKLTSIERPDFTTADKLTVVHPDAGWVNNSTPTAIRTNLVPTPNFETGIGAWTCDAPTTAISRSTAQSSTGAASLRLESVPERQNLMENPSFQNDIAGISSIGAGYQFTGAYSAGAGRAENGRCDLTYSNGGGAADDSIIFTRRDGSKFPVTAGLTYTASCYLNQLTGVGIYPTTTGGHPATIDMQLHWYNASGGFISTTSGGSWTSQFNTWTFRPYVQGTAPAGAAFCLVRLNFHATGGDWYIPNSTWQLDDLLLEPVGSLNSYFDGGYAGASWVGTADQTASYIHTAKDILAWTPFMSVAAAMNYVASLYVRAGSTGRSVKCSIYWWNASGTFLSQTDSGTGADSSASWTQKSASAVAPAGATQALVVVKVYGVPRGEYHYIDAVMLEQAAALAAFFDGDFADTGTLQYDWTGTPYSSSSTEKTFAAGSTVPPAETPTANTLVSNAPASNIYNFAYFYTISNEIGESAASQITVIRTQRRWTAWKWEAANAAGEPNGTLVSDPNLCADQLVAYMPQAVYDAAKAQGAVAWNLYMLTWSDQESVPVEGILLGTRSITASGTHGSEGWQRNTPALANTGYAAQLPTATNRYNYSKPPAAAQGLVAADRMILVDDPTAQAVIRWSSNQQGEYTNFTAAKGGGYKTLTSGNLYVPAAVKLWQNPQSVDTLTILCQGIDGLNTGYYMAPSSVSQQSEAVTVMGFEETTATPGTVSPYGCEVLNNALYHPLDTELMKSTAANYNINHKSQTDQIVNSWTKLQNKQRIVSAQHDGRLYFLVHNPDGAALQSGCMGNEVWVFDAMATTGTWSRWLIQASSLRRIEAGGKIYMSVVKPDGIYYLDPFYAYDDVVDPADRSVDTAVIPWRLETNTQGANRAHDAWAHLQQVNLSLGNFQGQMRWGIRFVDINGKYREVAKNTKDVEPPSSDGLPYDVLDFLKVARDVMEWRLFAESIDTVMSSGQIDFVQYRYTPVSVNVGYEYGEVETFEYTRSQIQATDRTTAHGVPLPMADTLRP
jgi:hypothetical protein